MTVNGRQLSGANIGFLNAASADYFYPPTPTGDPTAWADSTTFAQVSGYTSNPTFVFNGYFDPINVKYCFSDWGVSAITNTTLTCADTISAVTPAPAVGDVYAIYSTGGFYVQTVTVTSIISSTEVGISGWSGGAGMGQVASLMDSAFDAFAIRTIAFYIEWMTASKNMDVNVLSGRIAPGLNEFIMGVKEMYIGLIDTDPTASGYFVPEAIDALVQIISSKAPRT